MSLAIHRIGIAVPPETISQDDGLQVARALAAATPEQETWLPGMYKGTGIRSRGISFSSQLVCDVLEGTRLSDSPFLPTGDPTDRGPSTGIRLQYYAQLAPPLALTACREAIAAADVEPAAFTHLITVSCTGFMAPGLDRYLTFALGLRPTIERTQVGFMGCHGAINGLRVANALACQPGSRVLLCAVELCSLHYHYSYNPSKMIANAIFADGAAALVGHSAKDHEPWRVLATGSCYIPNSEDAMTWTIGDNGFEMTLARNVPGLIARHLRPWLEDWLGRLGVGLDGVRSWAVHPGGPKILVAVEEALQLKPTALATSREVFADHGNMSSPTVLFILRRLMEQQAARPCLMLGFGPGLVAEAALVG
jgi:predicted naringenin-chalcone synthase